MVNVLPEVPSFGTQFARSLGTGVSRGLSRSNEFANQMALEQTKANRNKKQEDLGKFESGLGVLRQMKDLVEKGNLGRGSGFMGLFGGETTQDRALFRQLGTSLIPLVAAGVPIRNRLEFEEYKKTITDPSAPDAELFGAIDGLERIFSQKLEGGSQSSKKKERVKFDINNPEHKSRRDQILSKSKGNRGKAEKVLLKEFDL